MVKFPLTERPRRRERRSDETEENYHFSILEDGMDVLYARTHQLNSAIEAVHIEGVVLRRDLAGSQEMHTEGLVGSLRQEIRDLAERIKELGTRFEAYRRDEVNRRSRVIWLGFVPWAIALSAVVVGSVVTALLLTRH